MSIPLVTYHLASTRQDAAIAHRAIDRYTGDVVSHLLNGRHSFPPIGIFPYRSNAALSQLRAVWTPPANVPLVPSIHYPYTPNHRDYRGEFQAIPPALKVDYARRYVE
jgi:hypothetical protein